MSELSNIEEYYRSKPDEFLIRLTENPGGLRFDVLPVLYQVLLEKSLTDSALRISTYIEQQQNAPVIKNFSGDQVKEYIQQRMESGESFVQVLNELSQQGVDLSAIAFEEENRKRKIIKHISKLKNQGNSGAQVKKEIQKTYGLDSSEIEELLSIVKKKGRRMLVLGLVLIVFSIMCGIVFLSINALPIPFILIFISGIILTFTGWFQLK